MKIIFLKNILCDFVCIFLRKLMHFENARFKNQSFEFSTFYTDEFNKNHFENWQTYREFDLKITQIKRFNQIHKIILQEN